MGKNKRQKRGFKGKKSPPSSSHKTKKGKNKPHHNDHEHGHGAHSSGGAATGAGGWWKTQLYDELEGDCGITDENQRKTLVHTVSELRKPTVNRYVKQVPVVDRKQVYIPEEPMDRGAMDEDDDDKDGTTSSDFSDEDLAGAYAGIKPIRGKLQISTEQSHEHKLLYRCHYCFPFLACFPTYRLLLQVLLHQGKKFEIHPRSIYRKTYD